MSATASAVTIRLTNTILLTYTNMTNAETDNSGMTIIPLISYMNLFVNVMKLEHDDVIKWKHFPRNWPFVRGIHRSPMNSPHKGQRRGSLMFSLICVGINGWANNCEGGDLRRHRAHYDVIVMYRHILLHVRGLINGFPPCFLGGVS